MILLQGEEKGAYANIVTVGCGGYCWRVKKRCVRQNSYSRVWMILLEGEEKGAYATIVTVGWG